ncbi:MAG: hypothetical protein IIX54_01185 [Clostridia bacterium]|nr:hypothetical protein [Clostridia bacterium]
MVEVSEPAETDGVSSILIEDDDDTVETGSTEELSDESSTDDSWREFLKEYEEWADKYIAVVKKYKANPTDLSILTEYTSLITELSDWTTRADDISSSIVDVKDATEFSTELARIAAKIADAAGDL